MFIKQFVLKHLRILVPAGVVAVIAGGIVAWWLISPLFIDTVVDEAFPFEMPSDSEMADMTPEEMSQMRSEFDQAMPSEATLADLSAEDRQAVQEKVMTVAAEMPDHPMEEPMPEQTGPVAILTGSFMGADSFHEGSGDAKVFRLPDDRTVLRFENFMVTNGPALSVLLSSNPTPALDGDLGDYIDLGPLKGNIGNQNYDISPSTNLDDFKSVVIYCVPFHVVFSTATLEQP